MKKNFGYGSVPGFLFPALLALLLVSIGKILFFRGTHVSQIIAISSYLLTVAISWVSFRAEKKANCPEVSEFSNVTGLILSLIFPIIELATLIVFIGQAVLFAKNMISMSFLPRQPEQDTWDWVPRPRRSKATKKPHMSNLRIGDRVRFNLPDQAPIEGVVARFNKKTVKVINQPGEYWNVPHGLLTKLKPIAKTQPRRTSLQLIKG